MNKVVTSSLILIIMCSTAVMSDNVHASESVDRADAATNVRLTIDGLEDSAGEEEGIFDKLRKLLGIRRPATIKPEIGKTFTVQASAYASSPYQTNSQPCITAAGTKVRYGVVATNFLPMGTLLDINGDPFIVEDRMNSRYQGYYMDLWFPSTSQALQFGRKNLKVTITGYGTPGQPLPTPEVTNEEVTTAETETTTNDESTEVSELKEGEVIEVIVLEEENTWDTFRSWTSLMTYTLSQLIPTRVNQDVNRHDVDCS